MSVLYRNNPFRPYSFEYEWKHMVGVLCNILISFQKSNALEDETALAVEFLERIPF